MMLQYIFLIRDIHLSQCKTTTWSYYSEHKFYDTMKVYLEKKVIFIDNQ